MRTPDWWKDIKRISFIDPRWLVIWITIYISFLLLDILMPNFWGSALLKYIGIFLCIIYANQKYSKDYNLELALLFTFLADTILVWTPYTLAGVYVFCFAQFMHLTRLTKLSHSALGIYALAISVFFALTITQGLAPIVAVATIYGLELICNIVMSVKNYRTDRKNFRARCAFYGFICFFCCDLCVALRFLAINNIIPTVALPLTSFLVWVFYYPSQVLIANSSTLKPKKSPKFAKTKRIS